MKVLILLSLIGLCCIVASAFPSEDRIESNENIEEAEGDDLEGSEQRYYGGRYGNRFGGGHYGNRFGGGHYGNRWGGGRYGNRWGGHYGNRFGNYGGHRYGRPHYGGGFYG